MFCTLIKITIIKVYKSFVKKVRIVKLNKISLSFREKGKSLCSPRYCETDETIISTVKLMGRYGSKMMLSQETCLN